MVNSLIKSSPDYIKVNINTTNCRKKKAQILISRVSLVFFLFFFLTARLISEKESETPVLNA